MVLINACVIRGPRHQKPWRVYAFAGGLTLRSIASSILEDEAGQLRYVTARNKLESSTTTYMEGEGLDATVDDLHTMGLHCVMTLHLRCRRAVCDYCGPGTPTNGAGK